MDLESRLTINDYVAAESDEESVDEGHATPKGVSDERAPYQKANIISRLTYSWVSGMFKIGYKRPIEIEDLDYLPKQCFTANATSKFHRYWKDEMEMAQSQKTKPKKGTNLQKGLLDDAPEEGDGDTEMDSPQPNLLKALLG